MDIALIGPGLVGKQVLAHIRQLPAGEQAIHVVAVMSTQKLTVYDQEGGGSTETSANLIALAQTMAARRKETGRAVCMVDCTSSDAVAAAYPVWLRLGLHIATPNKKAFSGSADLWHAIAQSSHPRCLNAPLVFHESSVGAGLPVLSTLRDLVESGERVLSVEGVLSGTLSYIFNKFSPATTSSSDEPPKFSDVVREAKSNGYTEPDPRDDLNGMDVARKVIILARAILCPLTTPTTTTAASIPSLADVQLDQLVPQHLLDLPSADDFMSQLDGLDTHVAALSANLHAQSSTSASSAVIRMAGVVDLSAARPHVKVQLSAYPLSHPFATLSGSDNMLLVTTDRSFPAANPLVIRGPGAGADVTAYGVVSDLLRIHRAVTYSPLSTAF
ncbi:Homoserine dehydrogenase [Sorochytrium milnesiophthora]